MPYVHTAPACAECADGVLNITAKGGGSTPDLHIGFVGTVNFEVILFTLQLTCTWLAKHVIRSGLQDEHVTIQLCAA